MKNSFKIALSFLMIGFVSPASAAVCVGSYQTCLNLGVNYNYGITALANGKTFNINSGPISGNVLIGNHVVTNSSGGGNGQIVGSVFTDGTATGDFFSHLQTPEPAPLSVATSVTASALASAQAVSAYAASLTATQAFSSNIVGNGGLNVINVSSLNNPTFTITGTANDYFVFNLNTFASNRPMTLVGAINPDHILFNLLGTSGNIFQTSGGDALYGTFLATGGGNFQFSNLVLTGRLINTAGAIQFVSGSKLTAPPTPPVPEPATWAMMILGFGAVGAKMRGRAKLRASQI